MQSAEKIPIKFPLTSNNIIIVSNNLVNFEVTFSYIGHFQNDGLLKELQIEKHKKIKASSFVKFLQNL